ncbi:MAG: hypothetical protein Q4Q07_07305 [Tissierellia bacterium]|nr:hypothetical protein [Tissierellia bacterium]
MNEQKSLKQEKTLSVYFSLLPFLILSNIIIGLLNGISSGAGKTGIIPIEKLGGYEVAQKSAEANITLTVGSILIEGLVLLISGAMLVAIYRRVRYRIQPKIRDLFIFYNDNFLRNYFFVLVLVIFRQIGYMLLFIPGIIFSIAMYLWPFVLMEKQEKFRERKSKNPMDFIKETYRRTNGYKGSILLTQLKWGALVFGIFLILILLITLSVGSINFEELNGNFLGAILAGSLLFITIIILFGVFVLPIFYCGHIELMQRLPNNIIEPPIKRELDDREDLNEDFEEPRREAYRESPFDTTRYPASDRSWGETGEFYDELHGYDTRDSHPGRGNTTELPKLNNDRDNQ